MEKNYPGGLANYHKNALKCLADAVSGANPYEGYVPKIPKRIKSFSFKLIKLVAEVLDFHSDQIEELEAIGLEEIKDTVFVLGFI